MFNYLLMTVCVFFPENCQRLKTINKTNPKSKYALFTLSSYHLHGFARWQSFLSECGLSSSLSIFVIEIMSMHKPRTFQHLNVLWLLYFKFIYKKKYNGPTLLFFFTRGPLKT